jgi:hypothetical protein
VIAVVSRAAPHVKIPEWEQVLSAGAAAMSLVLTAHALGYRENSCFPSRPLFGPRHA